MSGKAGAHVVETNKEQKHAMGKGANACANSFLAGMRGQLVRVSTADGPKTGMLIEFDLYALLLDTGGADKANPVLVFKGPGVTVEPAR